MIDHWLETATHPLPDSIAAEVKDELTAHYEDAVNDYLLQGYGADEARHWALADLGDARETAAHLKIAHLAGRRFRQAALASFGLLVSVFLLVFMTPGVPVFPQATPIQMVIVHLIMALEIVVMIGLLAFLLRSFEYLPTVDFGLPRRLIVGGLLALLPLVIFSSWREHPNQVLIVTDPFLIFSSSTALSTLPALFIGVVGTGWVIAGHRLSRVNFGGLSGPISAVFILSGLTILMQSVGVLIGHPLVPWFGLVLTVITGSIKLALCAMAFFRAIHRPPLLMA